MAVSLYFTRLSLSRFSVHAISHGRVFLALVERQEDRGTVVAQGAVVARRWHGVRWWQGDGKVVAEKLETASILGMTVGNRL